MKIFLCGGGSGIQTAEAYKRLNEVIDHSKPCLYIPLAMEHEKYDSCYRWITEELKAIDVPEIVMIRNAEELSNKDLFSYSVLFIGGGNTFKLLYDLKVSGAFEKIRDFMENGGVVFGSSAGAIIFGANLESCQLDDVNKVDLKETDGYDIFSGVSILCHYMNRTIEKDEKSKRYLLEISNHRQTVALPEEVTLFINGDNIEVIGDRPYYYFINGIVTKIKDNASVFTNREVWQNFLKEQ